MCELKTIVVVGGGITGLSAMYELQRWKEKTNQQARLILIEANKKLGGKIRSEHAKGFVMEAGADSMVTRKAKALPFLQELELDNEIVYNATGRSFIYTEGQLKPIPSDAVFGIPASIESLAKSALVSAEGKVEALKDFYTKNETFTASDSIGSFLTHFLGKELVEKQIAPVLSGVYSGDLQELTIASTLPQVLDYKNTYGSIIKGFEENKEKYQASGNKRFLSFRNGLATLVEAYEQKLTDVEILTETTVTKIEKLKEQRYLLTLDNGDRIEADYAVLSVPHHAAKSMLEHDKLQQLLAKLKSNSVISVYLGFTISDDVLPEEGTGFITATNDELSCNACTWTSRKWKHTSSEGNLLVRLFYKSSHPIFNKLLEMDEAEILQVALADVHKSIRVHAEPAAINITKWLQAMPNYFIGHPEVVAEIEKEMKLAYPGIYIAGCSYYGVGIPDCIENGANVAATIIANL